MSLTLMYSDIMKWYFKETFGGEFGGKLSSCKFFIINESLNTIVCSFQRKWNLKYGSKKRNGCCEIKFYL